MAKYEVTVMDFMQNKTFVVEASNIVTAIKSAIYLAGLQYATALDVDAREVKS